jgi:hypothetical protein
MSTNDPFERLIADYLADNAAGDPSDRALDDALASTSRMRPYPTWLADLKEPPMRIPARVVVGSPTLRLATILALTLALALALAGAVAGAASLLPSEPLPAPFGLARNGPLAYVMDGDIHLVDPDGANDRVIIAGQGVAGAGFGYQGDRLFYLKGPDTSPTIWITNADGTDPRMLLDHDVDQLEELPGRNQAATWSEGDATVSIIDLDTGAVVDGLDLGGPEIAGETWVRPPDGHELIVKGHPMPGGQDVALYGYDLDTKAVRQIGAAASDTSGRALSDGLRCTMCNLKFSPDGSTVAYWSREIQPDIDPGDDWYPHARNLDTGEDVALPLADTPAGVVFTFAPDGATFGFRWSAGPQMMVTGPLDGSAAVTVLGIPFDASVDGGFDFSPDGKKLYHTTRTPSETRIYDLAGGPDVVLQGVTQLPSWQRLPR